MKIIIVLLVIAAAGYGLLSYHFVFFDSRLKILKKTDVRYENTFIDARGIKKLELALNPDLAAAGINRLIGQVDSTMKKNTSQ